VAYDDDIIAFIEARLAEDEAAAKAATPGPWRTPCGPDDDDAVIEGTDGHAVADSHSCPDHPHRGASDALHIVRHNPARVLREVAAKRAILAEHGPANGGRDADRCRVCTAIAHTGMGHADARRFRAPCPTLLFLAAVYSDHPDYRAEWAVSPVG
jgi:hypothetical protein